MNERQRRARRDNSVMLRLERLDHFGVDVSDLQRAEEFYTKVLGMTVEMRLQDQILLRYGDGNCALFLKPDRELPDPAMIHHPLGKSHHAFRVRQISQSPRGSLPNVGFPTMRPLTGAIMTASTSSIRMGI